MTTIIFHSIPTSTKMLLDYKYRLKEKSDKAYKALPMGCSYVLTCQQYITYTHTVTVVIITRTSVPVSSDNVY